MADISKCHGTGCPLRDGCYRFTAPAHPFRQAYDTFASDPETGCPDFIDAKAREQAKWESAFDREAVGEAKPNRPIPPATSPFPSTQTREDQTP